MRTGLHDLRYALRQIAMRPVLYALIALILALGIGANTAMFTLADAALFRPLPVADQDALARVFIAESREASVASNGSYPQYADLAAARPGIADVAAFSDWLPVHVSLAGTEPVRARGGLATGTFFPLLGVRPALGRLLGPDDDRKFGGHPVVVLGHDYWRTTFDSSPDVLGREIQINRSPFTVVGVAAPGFASLNLDSPVDLWLPMTMSGVASPEDGGEQHRTNRGFSWLDFVVRLAPGRTLASAQAEMDAYSARLDAASTGKEQQGQGNWHRLIEARTAAVDPYAGEGIRRNAALLSGVVALLLLLACANVAGLLAARGEERAQELAVRIGLGASRLRVVRQLMAECVVLALVGVAAGLLVARALLVWIAAEAPAGIVLPLDPAHAVLDPRVLAAAVGSAILAVFAAGLLPAWRAVRIDVAPVLKGNAQAAVRGALRRSWRGALVALQIGLSAVILVAAGLLLRAFENTVRVAPGYVVEGGLTFGADLGRHGVPKDQYEATLERLATRVRALPGVERAAWANSVPVQNGGMRTSIEVAEPGAPKGAESNVEVVVTTPGYLETLGVPLLQGRTQEAGDAMPGVVVNRAMAQMFWPGLDPIGRRILNLDSERGGTPVVGVVANSRQRSLREQDRPILYIPYALFRLGSMTMLVRTSGDPLALLPAISRAVHELEPDLPLLRPRTLADRLSTSYAQARLFAYLTGAFAALAALLAGAGLYGALASALGSRTRELGLRLALGATPRRIRELVLADSGVVVATGLALGLAGAMAGTRLLEGLLFGVPAWDPLTFAAVGCTIALVGLGAIWLPTRRALAIEPMVALRHE